MKSSPGLSRMMGGCLLAAALSCGSGCFCYLHPVAAPLPQQSDLCQMSPLCARDHVYIFIANGLDPINLGNLTGVRDYIQKLGFNKTYFGQLYSESSFKRHILHIHADDSDARFVLVGFNVGGDLIHSLADAVQKDGVHIDLMVYLDGKPLVNNLKRSPENAGRVVSIRAPYLVWTAGEIDGAENLKLDPFWHFGLPTHPQTLDALARELAMVAATVPFSEPVNPTVPNPEETAPTPRPVMPRSSAQRDEWDFLKPVERGSNQSTQALKPPVISQ